MGEEFGGPAAPVRRLDKVSYSPKSSCITFCLSLLLILATFLLYYQVSTHPFFNLDDHVYVVDNANVNDGIRWSTVKWAFTSLYAFNWHPLTWLSHALDCTFFGLSPRGPHLTNLILHALDATLLFLVLKRATGSLWRSFMVAALFALHPINVESVAWIAERKTMLSMLFFLLSLAAYSRYARRPNLLNYGLVFLLYALGLMSKPQVITLPIILLLWDYWPLRRGFTPDNQKSLQKSAFASWRRRFLWLLLEKVPLFMLSGASGLVTMYAQGIARTQYFGYALPIRLANAVVSYVRYIGKALWPLALAPEYPHPGASLPHWQAWAALAILVGITALVILCRRHRYLLVGWLWFLIVLLPMIGLIQVGKQAMADRYAYLSFIGLFIMICWGTPDFFAWVANSWRTRTRQQQSPDSGYLYGVVSTPFALLFVMCVVSLATLSTLTYRQIEYWNDNLTLWRHAASVVKNDWIADDEIGLALQRMGKPVEEALPYFYRASAIEYSDRLSNSQIALYDHAHGRPREAIERYKRMLLNPYPARIEAEIYQNMGLEYLAVGDRVNAEKAFNDAVNLRLISKGGKIQ